MSVLLAMQTTLTEIAVRHECKDCFDLQEAITVHTGYTTPDNMWKKIMLFNSVTKFLTESDISCDHMMHAKAILSGKILQEQL